MLRNNKKDTKKILICIIGKGSIGKRHAKILKKLNCKIFFLRSKNYKIKNDFKISKKISFLKQINIFLITNPTSFHIKTLNMIKRFNAHIFIEKPLSDLSIHKIKNQLKKLSLSVGYMMRYDKRILKIKDLIKKNKPSYSKMIWQTYMPKWHQNENYLTSYASQKKLGGGVILTCSHEIDTSIFLYGKVKKVFVKKLENKLPIDVEDNVQIILFHKNGVTSEIFLDFANRNFSREIKVFFKKTIISWDFKKKSLIEQVNNKSQYIKTKFKNFDEVYVEQMKDLLRNYKKKNNKKLINNFYSTIHTQDVLIACKKSMIKNKIIRLD